MKFDQNLNIRKLNSVLFNTVVLIEYVCAALGEIKGFNVYSNKSHTYVL